MSQLHKKFTTEQIKELLNRYIDGAVDRKHLQGVLEIKKRRFFDLVKAYRKNPETFSIDYSRKTPKRISGDVEQNIIKELKIDQKIIKDKNNPLDRYNYSYIKNRLEKEYKQKVSLPTVINRAKKNGLYLKKRPKKRFMTAKS